MIHQLIGYADPVGRSEGFQIPLFAEPPANGLLVQRLTGERMIASFERLSEWEGKIRHVPHQPVLIGEPHRWAFAFGPDNVIEGSGQDGRQALAARIDDELLRAKPLLQREVAEFLDLSSERMAAATRALRSMAKLGDEVASTWLDLSVLTPDLRLALGRLATEPRGPFRRVVARVRNGEVEIAGLDGPPRADIEEELRLACTRVLDGLPGLYPPPRAGWSFELRKPDPPRPTRPISAIVYFGDERDAQASRLIDPFQREGILTYGERSLEAFAAIADDEPAPIFVISRGPAEVSDRAISMTGGRATEIVLDAQMLGGPGPRWREVQPPRGGRILVARNGNSRVRSSDAATARSIRTAVDAAAACLRTGDHPIRGTHVLVRATGIGPDPVIDAMATLHDRLAVTGQADAPGFLLDIGANFARHSNGLSIEALQGLLLPGLRQVEANRDMEASRSRISMAALAELDGPHEHGKPLLRRLAAVLQGRGWKVETLGEREEGGTLEITGRTGSHQLRLGDDQRDGRERYAIEKFGVPYIGPGMDLELSHLATPATILDVLKRQGAWTVDMRDLCASDPERGFWSIVAHQIRRLAGGQTSRARSRLLALLIESGLDPQGRKAIEASGAAELLRDTAGSGRLDLVWTRVREDNRATTAFVKFVAPRHFRKALAEPDLPAFGIAVHEDGLTFFESSLR